MRANSNESKMKLDEICGLFALLTTLVFLQFGLQESLAKKMGRPGKGRSKSHSSRIILLDNRRKEAFNHSDAATIVKASHFDYEFSLGHKIKFLCVAQGNPRPMITWFKDGVELQSHAFAYISELAIDSNRIQSKLEIDPAKQMDTGTYECQADNVHAVDRKQFKADF